MYKVPEPFLQRQAATATTKEALCREQTSNSVRLVICARETLRK